MTITVFIATTLDGFIARSDGLLDWLPAPPDEGDAFGYHAFIKSVDALVIGRHTYETVIGFGAWPYANKRVIVLSAKQVALPPELKSSVEVWNASAKEVTQRLASEGCRKLYVDGGKTIQGFVAASLVDELILTRVPILIGEGLPLFGRLDGDVHLKHVETIAHKSGLVQSHYLIPRELG